MSKNILIVDDDICLAYAIQSYLSSKEKKIFIVNDSIVALQLLRMYTFDLVISDIMMPRVDGYSLLNSLRIDTKLIYLPVVFLTAKGMTSDRVKAYDLGCNAYLTKPFHPSELIAIINNILIDKSKVVNNFTNVNNDFYLKLIARLSSKLQLTTREKSILFLLVKGMMNKEIASELRLSKRNVEKYVSRLLIKTRTRNRTELAQFILFFKGE